MGHLRSGNWLCQTDFGTAGSRISRKGRGLCNPNWMPSLPGVFNRGCRFISARWAAPPLMMPDQICYSRPRYTPAEWCLNSCSIAQDAERYRNASRRIRHQARCLSAQTDLQTRWNQHCTNVKLSDRIENICEWKEVLEKTLENLGVEMRNLTQVTCEAEKACEEKNVAMDIATQNMNTRDQCCACELSDDEVDCQLQKEIGVIRCSMEVLQEKIEEACQQLCLLELACQRLQNDLCNKNAALGVDIDTYNLIERYNPVGCMALNCGEPLDQCATTPQEWENFSRCNKKQAEGEIMVSGRMRMEICHTIQRTHDELEAQQNATDYALRKRIEELDCHRDELCCQKKKVENSISELECTMQCLRENICCKMKAIQFAQTRLENRSCRPNAEMCCDAAQCSLIHEIRQLECDKQILEEQFNEAQICLSRLNDQLNCLHKHLEEKCNCLTLDRHCLAVRGQMRCSPRCQCNQNCLPSPCSQTCLPEPCSKSCPPCCPPSPCSKSCPPSPCSQSCLPSPCSQSCSPSPCYQSCPSSPCMPKALLQSLSDTDCAC